MYVALLSWHRSIAGRFTWQYAVESDSHGSVLLKVLHMPRIVCDTICPELYVILMMYQLLHFGNCLTIAHINIP